MPQKFDNMDRLYTTNINPADALWALIQGQTQSVKDALYQRMKEANSQRLTLQQQQYVSKALKGHSQSWKRHEHQIWNFQMLLI